jgi:phage I-like protein
MHIKNSAITKIKQALHVAPRPFEHEHIVALNAAGEDGGDKKFLAVAIGEFPNHKDGAHAVTREHCAAMAALIVAGKLPVLVDYGHESRWNAAAIAAGWINKDSAEVRDDGLYLARPDWTEKADAHIKAGEYLALSSSYLLNGVDKYGKLIPAKLLSIALTNVPYMETEVDHIPQISNSQIQEDFEMTWTDQERQALIAKYSLAANADETAIKTAILNAAAEPADPPEKDPPEPKPETTAANAEVEALKISIADLTKAVTGLTAANAATQKARIETLVDKAISEKRILPKQRDTYLAAANADFAKTQAELASIPANAVIPALDVQAGKDGKVASNALADATAYFKTRGRIPIVVASTN